jgi:pyrroloquinoline-quinone synthase
MTVSLGCDCVSEKKDIVIFFDTIWYTKYTIQCASEFLKHTFRRRLIVTNLLSKDEFRKELEEAIKGNHSQKAPFTVAWAEGKLERKHFARWAENHYHYVGPFANYLSYIYHNTPDHPKFEDAKDFTLQNMYEEEIAADRHTDLLIRFAEACGTTADRVRDPKNMAATTLGLQSWCYSVAARENFVVATAALVVGLESQVPDIYRKQTPILREKYGFTDEEIEFFDLHIVSDEIHGERGFKIVLEHADTPELQQECLEIVRVGAKMRRMYMDGLWREYLEQDLGSLVQA